jgi:hypothetical protein
MREINLMRQPGKRGLLCRFKGRQAVIIECGVRINVLIMRVLLSPFFAYRFVRDNIVTAVIIIVVAAAIKTLME